MLPSGRTKTEIWSGKSKKTLFLPSRVELPISHHSRTQEGSVVGLVTEEGPLLSWRKMPKAYERWTPPRPHRVVTGTEHAMIP